MSSLPQLILCLLLLCTQVLAFAQTPPNTPDSSTPRSNNMTPAEAQAHFASWITEGWQLELYRTGDLNHNGQQDTLLVLLEDDPNKLIAHQDNDDAPPLNVNSRRLIILLGGASGDQLLISRDDFLPPPANADAPCLADPLDDIQLHSGALLIQLRYFLSCGSNWTASQTLHFVMVEDRLRLAEYRYFGFSRYHGEVTHFTLDYLTSTLHRTLNENVFEDTKVSIENLPLSPLPPFYLEHIDLICDQPAAPACAWSRAGQ